MLPLNLCNSQPSTHAIPYNSVSHPPHPLCHISLLFFAVSRKQTGVGLLPPNLCDTNMPPSPTRKHETVRDVVIPTPSTTTTIIFHSLRPAYLGESKLVSRATHAESRGRSPSARARKRLRSFAGRTILTTPLEQTVSGGPFSSRR